MVQRLKVLLSRTRSAMKENLARARALNNDVATQLANILSAMKISVTQDTVAQAKRMGQLKAASDDNEATDKQALEYQDTYMEVRVKATKLARIEDTKAEEIVTMFDKSVKMRETAEKRFSEFEMYNAGGDMGKKKSIIKLGMPYNAPNPISPAQALQEMEVPFAILQFPHFIRTAFVERMRPMMTPTSNEADDRERGFLVAFSTEQARPIIEFHVEMPAQTQIAQVSIRQISGGITDAKLQALIWILAAYLARNGPPDTSITFPKTVQRGGELVTSTVNRILRDGIKIQARRMRERLRSIQDCYKDWKGDIPSLRSLDVTNEAEILQQAVLVAIAAADAVSATFPSARLAAILGILNANDLLIDDFAETLAGIVDEFIKSHKSFRSLQARYALDPTVSYLWRAPARAGHFRRLPFDSDDESKEPTSTSTLSQTSIMLFRKQEEMRRAVAEAMGGNKFVRKGDKEMFARVNKRLKDLYDANLSSAVREGMFTDGVGAFRRTEYS